MKFFLELVLKIRQMYWRIARPKTLGVRALIINGQGKILLVKHKYGNGWFLPGGRLKKNEPLEDGLKRELKEELGITFLSASRILGTYTNTQEYKRDTITVYVVKDFSIAEKSHFEIQDKNFFAIENLPSDTSPGTKRRILEYLGQRQISTNW